MIEYDPHNWIDHFFDVKGSMVREIIGRVLLVTGWSVVVTLIHRYLYPVAVPSTVHTLVGIALGLLLVFRTNASYDRFWEGRRMWGGIVNETRNLGRLASVALREHPSALRPILLWTIAFPYAAMHALRGQSDIGPTAERLPRHEVDAILCAQHTPLAVARQITRQLLAARDAGLLSDYVAIEIDRNTQLLIDYLGACERIQKTPLPFAYVVHLRRALVLYCMTLPFALLEPFGWSTVLDTFLVAYIFFGIEEIGVEIEGPFGEDENDLPLEQICGTIENNLLGLMGKEEA